MTLAGQADRKASYAILDASFEGGIRFLDTADVYPIPMLLDSYGDTETLLGQWMALKKNRVVDLKRFRESEFFMKMSMRDVR